MERRILIGSIIAVVILVMVSFTSVVGYNSVESNSVKASPLFNLRTNRAIGEESKILTAKYVGKGNILSFPERDDRTVLIQKVVDSIRMMDDKTYERFIASIITSAQKNERLIGINPDEIKGVFYQVKDSGTPIPIFDYDTGNKYPTVGDCVTFGYGIIGIYVCLILPFIILREIIIEIIGFIWGIFHLNTGLPMCIPPTAVVC